MVALARCRSTSYLDKCLTSQLLILDPVKRKVISELFFAPSVVLPIVAGISAGLLSWAGGGVNYLSAAAMLGVLGGIGWMATRIIFKVEEITDAAMKLHESQRKQATEEELDELERQLRQDGDPRTQDYLTLLRSLRDDFHRTSSQPEFKAAAANYAIASTMSSAPRSRNCARRSN